jgi:ATP-dependent helicase HrpB
VALAIEQRKGGGRGPRTVVRSAAELEPEWLLELFPDRVEDHIRARFDPQRERVEATAESRYEGLVIDSTALRELPPQAEAVLRDAAFERGPGAFVSEPAALEHLTVRTMFAARFDPTVEVLDEARAFAVLERLCVGHGSFAELRRADLLAHLRAELSAPATAALARLAPTHVTLPGGRRLPVHYERDRTPWVQSRLQDFFGQRHGPSIAGGAEPLVLHLLAPNQRAVQVTTDLEGFWDRHYPSLHRQLARRYPKHDWPEDPLHAKPPAPTRGRPRFRGGS